MVVDVHYTFVQLVYCSDSQPGFGGYLEISIHIYIYQVVDIRGSLCLYLCLLIFSITPYHVVANTERKSQFTEILPSTEKNIQ